MIHKTEVGKRISNLREKLGCTQADFAEKLDVSTQAVSKWETGLCLPSIELLLRIAWMGNVSIEYILDGTRSYISEIPCVERALWNAEQFLICPICKMPLKLDSSKGGEHLSFQCGHSHKYPVVDGVIYFHTREIPGEQWSLSYLNYEDYQKAHSAPKNLNFARGINFNDIMWEEIKKQKPSVLIDLACGMGTGTAAFVEKINWPITIFMTDLSHRILKWNKTYFSAKKSNPYVDLVYFACDCAKLPMRSNFADIVFSCGGIESMQEKWKLGLREAHRVLKPNGSLIDTANHIESHSSANSKKWAELFTPLAPYCESLLLDAREKTDQMKSAGFSNVQLIPVYTELPAPAGDQFPFKNEISQWMALSIAVSTK